MPDTTKDMTKDMTKEDTSIDVPSVPPAFLTIFFRVRTTSAWLAKTPQAREAFRQQVLQPILGRRMGVRLRYFDAEAYNADTTDVLMWEVSDEADYRALIEDLRETPFWGQYFDVLEIIPTVEDGFASHYRVTPFGAPG